MTSISTFPLLTSGEAGGVVIPSPPANATGLIVAQLAESGAFENLNFTAKELDGQVAAHYNSVLDASVKCGVYALVWNKTQLDAMTLPAALTIADSVVIGNGEYVVLWIIDGDTTNPIKDAAGFGHGDGTSIQRYTVNGTLSNPGDIPLLFGVNIIQNRSFTALGGAVDTFRHSVSRNGSSMAYASGAAVGGSGAWSAYLDADLANTGDVGLLGLMVAAGTVSPTITSVGGDDNVLDEESLVAVVGTNFPADVDGCQIGGVPQSSFQRASDTLCSFNVVLGSNRFNEDVTFDLLDGAAVVASRTIQINSQWDAVAVLADPLADAANRPTSIPSAAAGDQWEARVTEGSGTVEIRSNGSLRVQDTVGAVELRSHDGQTWGAWGLQTFGDPLALAGDGRLGLTSAGSMLMEYFFTGDGQLGLVGDSTMSEDGSFEGHGLIGLVSNAVMLSSVSFAGDGRLGLVSNSKMVSGTVNEKANTVTLPGVLPFPDATEFTISGLDLDSASVITVEVDTAEWQNVVDDKYQGIYLEVFVNNGWLGVGIFTSLANRLYTSSNYNSAWFDILNGALTSVLDTPARVSALRVNQQGAWIAGDLDESQTVVKISARGLS